MTILVTGGAGYIGSHMAWLLIDAGEDVCIIDNLSTGVESAIPGRAIFEKGDAGDGKVEFSFVELVVASITAAIGWVAGLYWARHPLLPELLDPLRRVRLPGLLLFRRSASLAK